MACKSRRYVEGQETESVALLKMTNPKTPIFRGYDSAALYRQDTLPRIRQLEKEIQESLKRIEERLSVLFLGNAVDRSGMAQGINKARFLFSGDGQPDVVQ